MNFIQKNLNATLKKLSKIKSSSVMTPTKENLAGFRKAQRLAFQCATDITKEIKPGWTEKQTAKLMDTYLRDNGVKSFFHKSFAWFAERTRFENFTNYFHFMPSNRVLQENDPIILDTAPILDGFAADIGYSYCLNPSKEFKQAQEDLRFYRKKIRDLFASSSTTAEIWKIIDEDFKSKNYTNCHKKYPFGVLGHRLHKMPFTHLPGVTIPFSLHSYFALISRGLFPELLSETHEGSKLGIWAIEPHVGAKGFGAKFEEILVVDNNEVYWLDEDVPHNKAH